MLGLGWPEVLVILGVVVLVFGSKRIPEVGSALGKTLRGFKEEFDSPEESEDFEDRDL
ncbi:Sec-independent protein translocase protein tatA/E-like protein [[Leptolyngbya] sp. PCC 7376]|uniref:twin-arginine translocase TatA/TatE family subunit n=1 Tax=[Leptolyngbya] sp. PCC 7376 TaxID=111781 RepID=UPI00029F3972|nr:twin-arginine translocase TatA/TatE family subunit [[Leptolyngbya] sp. PCC 7376]AFY38067.1 Sec-independent protein translocase protein tatA/E-like protein [[Leptolyngbya] sp. PCC 7376]